MYRVDTQDNVDEWEITLYEFDGRGLVTKEINALRDVTTYVYDGNKNLKTKTDADGKVTEYTYNGLDMVTHINYNEGKQVSYRYNKVGDLVEMNDWTGKTSFEVDLLSKITKTTDTKGKAIEYTYDEVGNQTSVKYPDNTIATKTYDLLGNIKTVTETDGRTTSYTYDGMARISKMEYPHGWVEDYYYNSIGQLIKVEDTDPSKKDMKQQKHIYRYDSLGNLTYETSQGNKSVDYKLNNLNQITKKSEDGWKTQKDYTYDKRGNLIQETYTKNNKVEVTGAYTYDETNKMVLGVNEQGESSAYLYNGLDALVENTWVIKKNAYGYHDVSALTTNEDVVDTKAGKQDKNNKNNKNNPEPLEVSPELNKNSTVVKQFVVDYTSETFEPLMEYEVNGLEYRYVYGNDRLSVNITGVDNGAGKLIENGNQIRLYYHMDYLGTTDYLTSPMTGKVESWTHYNEWGEITHNAVLKSGQRQLDMVKRYATHDYDSVLNMYYAKARFYDAENRKFTAIDPILDSSKYDITDYVKNPLELVQYLYVGNNPIIYIDPEGLFYVIDDLDIHGINAARERQKKTEEDKLFNYLYNRPGYNNIYLKRIAPPAPIPEIKLGPVTDYTNYIEKCTKKTDYTIPTILAIDSGDKNADIAYTKWWDNRPIEKYDGDPRYTAMTVASFQNLLLRMSTKGTDVSKLSVAELNKLFDGELNAQGEATMAMFGAAVAILKNSANASNLISKIRGTSSTGTDLARQLGREGEEAARIVNPKQRIPSLSGTAKYRIPDELLHDQKILREIKNVSSQSFTNQLKDFNAWAKQNGYQFILEVRPGAKLSGPLQEAIKNGEIILKNIGQ